MVCGGEAESCRHGSENGQDADAEVFEDGEFAYGSLGMLFVGEWEELGFAGSGLFGGVDYRNTCGDSLLSEFASGDFGQRVFGGFGDVSDTDASGVRFTALHAIPISHTISKSLSRKK